MRQHRHYIEHAVRIRQRAVSTSDPELRSHLEVLAEEYDHMAEVADHIASARRRIEAAWITPIRHPARHEDDAKLRALPRDTPGYHERQATHLRALAEAEPTPAVKNRLLRQAEEHEQMALG